ncbi:MAG TPA: GNAT family N-acetyltransferase [Pseudonocardia sp.]|jgi:hypothetical protein
MSRARHAARAVPARPETAERAAMVPLPRRADHPLAGGFEVRARVVVRRETAPGPEALRQWDRLVRDTPGTDVTQLSGWARVRSLVGYRPVFLLAYQSDTVVGGALVLTRRVARVLSIGYLPYGPVVSRDVAAARTEVTAALVAAVVELSDELTMTFVQPPEGSGEVSDALAGAGFRASRAGIAPAGSYRLDLTPPLEVIRGRFSKRLKSWTNRWEAKGVRIRQGDERDLPLLLELMEHTGARQGFTPPGLDYVTALYRELAAQGQVAVFVGEVHGVAVSADLVTVAGGMVRGRLGGFNGRGEAGKLSVPAAVRWEIIRWAKEQGHRYLDFGGLPERMLADMLDRGIAHSDEWPSSHCAKLSFSGAPFRYPESMERIRPAPVRLGYDLASNNPMGQRAAAKAKKLLRGGR